MSRRQLSEEEFEAIRKKVLAKAPRGLSEEEFTRWSDRMGRNLMESEITEAEHAPEPPKGSALGRFVENAAGTAWDVAKDLGTGAIDLAFPSPEGMIRGINRGEAIVKGSEDQAAKAKQAFGEGRYSEAAGHAAGVLPPLTPFAQAGEQMGTGDLAGGLGKAATLAAGLRAPTYAAAAGEGVRAVAGSRAPAVAAALAHDVVGRRFPTTRRALRTAKAATAEPPPNQNAGGRLVGKPPAEPSIEQVIAEALTANEEVGRSLPDTTGSPSVTMSPRVREVLKKQGQAPRAGTPGSQTPRAQGGGLSLGPAAKSRYLELSRKVILEPAEELELAHWHRLFKQAASESGTYYAAVGKKAK